jgi:hypothetical protein
VKALGYGGTAALTERAPRLARKRAGAAGVVLLTHVPMVGTWAHRAAGVFRVSNEPQGIEQHYGCLKEPLMGTSRFFKKADRVEAFGLVGVLVRML